MTRISAKNIRQEDAFVLVSVIWLAGLLAMVTAAFSLSVRVNTLTGSNIVHNARAELIADGLVRLVAIRLATQKDQVRPERRDGSALRCLWGKDAAAEIALQDQGGLIDLNTSSLELLETVLKGIGRNSEQAKVLAESISDFRDQNTVAARGGAELMAYTGKTFGPKNAPFQVIEELAQIPGIDDALYNSLKPLVTTHSLQPGFDPESMPAKLKTVLGINDAANLPPSIAVMRSQSPGNVFAINVAVQLAGGATYVRHAIISLLRQPERPFAILAWQRSRKLPFAMPLKRDGLTLDCLNLEL